jgi:acyl carrier protein
MPDPVFDKVETFLVESLNVPREKIHPGANFRHDLGLDSFAAVELSFALEEAFSIEVKDEEIAAIHTIGELVEAVKKKIQGEPSAQPAQP